MLNNGHLVALFGFIIVSDFFGGGPTFHHTVLVALFHEAKGGAIVIVPLLHRCEKLVI